MPPARQPVVIDDRLLIEELLVGLRGDHVALHTTSYWYYRACRAAMLGAGGHLSGPFERLEADQQERGILSLLELRPDISLPDPRSTVPQMARVARHYPELNLLNLEAVAAGQILGATVWLSTETARGLLPEVLDQEQVPWQTITPPAD
ncbi:MAG: hypothetical protein ACYDGN_17190 [Acidimicrobiales bacterium]